MSFKKIASAFSLLFILGLVALFFAKQQIDDYLTFPRIDKTQLITVSEGSHYTGLGDEFLAQSIVADLRWWKIIGKLRPELTQIRSGTYQIKEGASLEDILLIINTGKEFQFKVTFIEGSTFKEWLAIIEEAEYLQPLQKSEKELLDELGIPHAKLEGLLFPETYHYRANMSAYKIIKKAYQHQLTVLNKLWDEREAGLPYKTPYEALIMASIIEKESGLSDDRDKISSVFVNRLRIGMRLQTDPTVIYGMGERYDGRIRSKDLREKTAYNTYRIDGLPPTPIAMPSEAALYATLHPAKTKFLYFVSKGDGTSYFSKNLKEHNRAVQKYILGK
ncbi:endolytic transglycosylase MltG [Psychromonas sp. psych-6C06]|uniref:endolytic transglycosylase MltG n=1 Tax=Psychromonas sp. psych-6C06 TaxID=2058089 RepID=UPI000C33A731|nr:endolytic transglycosylase MltG [Psychromonas sp. psych-6C06]PKF62601.1 endolytic transglycosylase MltG [Psychromonas sp. psych-6C06]